MLQALTGQPWFKQAFQINKKRVSIFCIKITHIPGMGKISPYFSGFYYNKTGKTQKLPHFNLAQFLLYNWYEIL
jgi:hypothetical protein